MPGKEQKKARQKCTGSAHAGRPLPDEAGKQLSYDHHLCDQVSGLCSKSVVGIQATGSGRNRNIVGRNLTELATACGCSTKGGQHAFAKCKTLNSAIKRISEPIEVM